MPDKNPADKWAVAAGIIGVLEIKYISDVGIPWFNNIEQDRTTINENYASAKATFDQGLENMFLSGEDLAALENNYRVLERVAGDVGGEESFIGGSTGSRARMLGDFAE